MNEHEVSDKIKKMSAGLNPPDSLHPENCENIISKAVNKRRKKTFRISGVVSFCILLLMASSSILLNWRDITGSVTGNSPGTGTAAAKSPNTSTAASGDTSTSIAEYKDLYKMLAKLKEDSIYSSKNMEIGIEEFADSAMTSETQAAAGSADYSATNTQVEDVDEGDIVKTDGKYIYILRSGGEDRRIHIVEFVNGELKEVGVISLNADAAEDNNYPPDIREIYLKDNVLVAVGTVYRQDKTYTDSDDLSYIYSDNAQTVLYFYDITDPAGAKALSTLYQDGYYNSSRIVDGFLYTVSQRDLYNPLVREDISTYVPTVDDELLSRDSIICPATPSTPAYSVVTAVNLADCTGFSDAKALLCTVNTLYMNNKSIYLTSASYSSTEIIKLSYHKGKMEKTAEATVEGIINNQFSMDEYNGNLRMVVTDYNNGTDNSLYILDEELNLIGSVEGLAKDEFIYSARFMGDTVYFVTYRQVDPLFAVDLSDPKNPVVMDALKIPGFSTYLHSYGDGLLLGIGQYGNESGWIGNVKVSMFDTSDPYNIAELDSYVVDSAYAEALYNHKAVLVNVERNIIGFGGDCSIELEDGEYTYSVPYYIMGYDGEKGFYRKATLEVGGEGSSYYNSNTRGLYIGDTLFVVNTGEGLIAAYDMNDEFKELSTLKFMGN